MKQWCGKGIYLLVFIIAIMINPAQSFSQTDGAYRSKWISKLHTRAVQCFRSGDFDKGKILFKEIIDSTRKAGEEESEAGIWEEFAMLIPSRDSTGITRMYCFEKMVSLYKKAGNEQREIEALKSIANLNLLHGKHDLAERQLLNVLRRYQAIGYPKIYYVYDLLAVTNRYQGDFSKGISYALRAIEYMEAAHDYSPATTFYSRLANMYRELGQTENSIEWYWEVFRKREYLEKVNLYMFRDAGFLARALIKQKKEKTALAFILDISAKNRPNGIYAKASLLASLAYCYQALHQPQRAGKYYSELVKLTGQLGKDNEVATDVYYEMGQYFMNNHEYGKAKIFLQKALNAQKGINSIADTKEIYLMLFKADSAIGNYQSATDNLWKHMILKDSIFNEIKSRQIEELQVKYEIAKRKKDIEVLNNQNKQAHREKNIALGCAGLLIVIIGLLFNSYLSKQKSNRNFELHQRELDQKNTFLETLNAEQDKLLKDKVWLIDEVQHRVKNNLQMVVSLLNTQSVYLTDEAAVATVKDSLRRVQTMSLIHQKLYVDENTSLIDMPEYINDLVDYLRESFDMDTRISFQQTVEPLYLDVSQAVPLGLIINESVVNSIKYSKDQDVTVHISLRREDENHLLLEIADNGVGLPVEFDWVEHQSMGLDLLKGLSKQLKGHLSIKNNNGVQIMVRFIALKG